MAKIPKGILSLFLVISVIVFAMSLYEIFFNFSIWASLMSTGTPNPDQGVNLYPVNTVHVNLVYATKIFVALIFISYFAIASIKNSIAATATT